MILRELTADDWPQTRQLSGLAFGYAAPELQPPESPAIRIGAFDGPRLVAIAAGRPYEQWWCGRPVAMCGIAGVAVHPDARAGGLIRPLMDAVVQRSEAPISVLFPTAPGIYRSLGWEVIGRLEETGVPLTALPTQVPAGVTTRSAQPADLPRLHELYGDRGRSGSGLLTREGPSFPQGPEGLLEVDVVTVAEEQGVITGWMTYQRGHGYRHGGPLRLLDAVVSTPSAMTALLAGLASWSAVVDEVRWRGSTEELAWASRAALPPPTSAQPWMLRVLDVAAALESRGWRHDGTASFGVGDEAWRVEAAGGVAQVTAVPNEGLPQLHPRGLALLFAGRDPAALLRAGLLDRPAPELSLFGGPAPEILDYF